MSERLNNDQIIQRITEANSDLKRYLNLAPGLKPTPPQPITPNEYFQDLILTPLSPQPTLQP
ncbi:conserved hypothetical protein [Candidatus Desulfosporosinus infrequens]|uniref:Uncharacterized protein n=1 Tax=Candidatus Desulfosporosinus infrequens TaxID=2043169 RepID=A0A2U3LP96_9FIRM|nr:conserved hypothetical protein [Candidatus Desulfosporosinus infrequens]